MFVKFEIHFPQSVVHLIIFDFHMPLHVCSLNLVLVMSSFHIRDTLHEHFVVWLCHIIHTGLLAGEHEAAH